tara:strand:+ start:279 stop:1265 length:987 start_codon:yes stop_codon:yes gene_type:complete
MPSVDIEHVIRNYQPSTRTAPGQWHSVAPVVRDWVSCAAPTHHARARQLLSAGANLALWCLDQSIPVTTDTALRDTTIERFCAVAEHSDRYSATTRATIRSRLRCLAQANRVSGNAAALPPIARRRVRPPYSPQEVSALWRLPRVQPTATKRRRLEALLVLGLGAGCAAEDLRHLRPSDVRAGPSGVVVTIQGPRPRTVCVLDCYAVRAAAVVTACDETYLIGGVKPTRRSVTTGLLQRMAGDPGAPTLEPGRLRSTWLLTHLMAGTRLDVLMDAAGLSTPASILDLIRYLQPLPAPMAQRLQRCETPAQEAYAQAIERPGPSGRSGS